MTVPEGFTQVGWYDPETRRVYPMGEDLDPMRYEDHLAVRQAVWVEGEQP